MRITSDKFILSSELENGNFPQLFANNYRERVKETIFGFDFKMPKPVSSANYPTQKSDSKEEEPLFFDFKSYLGII